VGGSVPLKCEDFRERKVWHPADLL